MAEMPNTQTPEEEIPETPETPASPETPEEGAGPEETGEIIPSGSEFSPEKKVKELERDYSASSREAKRLAEENKLLRTQLESNIFGAAPSDEEAARQVPDWDLLSPAEQHLWKEHILLKRQFSRLGHSVAQTAKEVTWNKQFTQLAKNPTYSELSKKKEEFEEFCEGAEPTEILAKAFLFDKAKEIGAQEEKKRTRPGLETGAGGEKRAPLSQELSDEQKKYLRINNPREYQKLIRAGKIK